MKLVSYDVTALYLAITQSKLVSYDCIVSWHYTVTLVSFNCIVSWRYTVKLVSYVMISLHLGVTQSSWLVMIALYL